MIPIFALAVLIESQLQVLLIFNRPPLLILKNSPLLILKKASLLRAVIALIVDRKTGELIVKKCEDFGGVVWQGVSLALLLGGDRRRSHFPQPPIPSNETHHLFCGTGHRRRLVWSVCWILCTLVKPSGNR